MLLKVAVWLRGSGRPSSTNAEFRWHSGHLQLADVNPGFTKRVCNRGGFKRQGSMDTTEIQSAFLQTPFGNLESRMWLPWSKVGL